MLSTVGALEINDLPVTLTGKNVYEAIESSLFRDWVKSLDPRFSVRSVEIQSMDFIGSPDKRRLLFLKFSADVVDDKGNFIPGIVFMRGGVVGILVILTCQGKDYVVLTVQPRLPVGDFALAEIPAGMMDGDGHFTGVAARELEEETGIVISDGDLVDLTNGACGNTWPGVYLSPGGSDEFVRLFLYQKEVTEEELEVLQGRLTGLREEGEQITLMVVPLATLPQFAPDAKALSALALYNFLREKE